MLQCKEEADQVISHDLTTCRLKPFSVWWTQADRYRPGDMYQDSGCNRCIGGEEHHEKWRKYLLQFGIKPVYVEKKEEFAFGNDQAEMSTCAWLYPMFLDGKYVGDIDVASVKSPCPPLW